jgi:hypothetical protein
MSCCFFCKCVGDYLEHNYCFCNTGFSHSTICFKLKQHSTNRNLAKRGAPIRSKCGSRYARSLLVPLRRMPTWMTTLGVAGLTSNATQDWPRSQESHKPRWTNNGHNNHSPCPLTMAAQWHLFITTLKFTVYRDLKYLSSVVYCVKYLRRYFSPFTMRVAHTTQTQTQTVTCIPIHKEIHFVISAQEPTRSQTVEEGSAVQVTKWPGVPRTKSPKNNTLTPWQAWSTSREKLLAFQGELYIVDSTQQEARTATFQWVS